MLQIADRLRSLSIPSALLANTLIEYVQKKEEIRLLQDLILKELGSNITSTDGKNIDITSLTQKYPHSFMPADILFNLYWHGNSCLSSERNMFNLPPKRHIFKRSIYEDHVDDIKKYKEITDTFGDSYQRFLTHYKYSAILKHNADFDHVKFSWTLSDKDGIELDIESCEIWPKEKRYTNLWEVKEIRTLDFPTIKQILYLSEDKYINIIEGVPIKQKFDGSNIYDMLSYDQIYGEGSFLKVLLGSISSLVSLEGASSIRYQKTVNLIREKALLLCKDEVKAQEIIKIFLENSIHINGDTMINIGKLMELYQITGEELFLSMYFFSSPLPTEPCMVNYLSSRMESQKFDLVGATEVLKEKDYIIDYHHGICFKCTFRQETGENQTVDMHKYDYCNGKLYEVLFSSMLLKNKSPPTETFVDVD